MCYPSATIDHALTPIGADTNYRDHVSFTIYIDRKTSNHNLALSVLAFCFLEMCYDEAIRICILVLSKLLINVGNEVSHSAVEAHVHWGTQEECPTDINHRHVSFCHCNRVRLKPYFTHGGCIS